MRVTNTNTSNNLAAPAFSTAAPYKHAPLRPEEIIIIVLLFIFCSLPFLLSDQPISLVSAKEMGIGATGGDSAKQLILVGLYGLTGFALLPRIDTRLRDAISLPLVLLTLWIFMSAVWSDLSALTLRRGVALTGTLVVGLYLAARVEVSRLVYLLNILTIAVLSACFIVALFAPESGLDQESRLRGVFAHKNSLASFVAISLIVSGTAIFNEHVGLKKTALPWVAALMSSVALVAAHSATPTIAVCVSIALLFLICKQDAGAPHNASRTMCALVIVGIMILPLIAAYVGQLATVFGRSTDFSGRTSVWTFALAFLQRRPLQGFGYTAFWNGTAGLLFYRWAHFPVAHAHNGTLQLMLDCGLVGLGLYTLICINLLNKLHSLLNSPYRLEIAWISTYLILYFLTNLAEVHLFEPNDLYTILFVYAITRLNLVYNERKKLSVSTRPSEHFAQTFPKK